MNILRWGLASTVLAITGVAQVQAADPIAAWNQISESAVKTAGHPPPVAAPDFAIVHLAIYDAVESIDGAACEQLCAGSFTNDS